MTATPPTKQAAPVSLGGLQVQLTQLIKKTCNIQTASELQIFAQGEGWMEG